MSDDYTATIQSIRAQYGYPGVGNVADFDKALNAHDEEVLRKYIERRDIIEASTPTLAVESQDAVIAAQAAVIGSISEAVAVGRRTEAEARADLQRIADLVDAYGVVGPHKALDAVKAEAWDEGAKWAAVETGAIRDERERWLAPGDNPYRTT